MIRKKSKTKNKFNSFKQSDSASTNKGYTRKKYLLGNVDRRTEIKIIINVEIASCTISIRNN